MRIIKVKLKERLNERGIGQKQLAEMTNLTERTISELANNKTLRYPKNAIETIAAALDITDMNDLLLLEEKD